MQLGLTLKLKTLDAGPGFPRRHLHTHTPIIVPFCLPNFQTQQTKPCVYISRCSLLAGVFHDLRPSKHTQAASSCGFRRHPYDFWWPAARRLVTRRRTREQALDTFLLRSLTWQLTFASMGVCSLIQPEAKHVDVSGSGDGFICFPRLILLAAT